jgi:DNA-binding beta-propeller fold protein YncE
MDTSLGDDDSPVDRTLNVVSLCDGPNVLAVHRPASGEALALVTCGTAQRLAVVELGSFRVVASVPVGVGAYEVVVDEERQQAYVSNPGEDTISIVSLEPGSPRRFTEWARIGVGAGSRYL